MDLPQGPADSSTPSEDPSPTAGTAGPSQAPASPAASRRALLRELEAQVQAAYGQRSQEVSRGQGSLSPPLSTLSGHPQHSLSPFSPGTRARADPGEGHEGRQARGCLRKQWPLQLGPGASWAGPKWPPLS
ncbi:hypothetical protein GHT09_001136 [Marmota monax]|uniref:Uncharacterized protein n=1 Tax=Marmota monax TaxID=9995 RepID=A0A834Q298_MARMO|nr:hypothetical protein GHT09_001136 [Marmota monax]